MECCSGQAVSSLPGLRRLWKSGYEVALTELRLRHGAMDKSSANFNTGTRADVKKWNARRDAERFNNAQLYAMFPGFHHQQVTVDPAPVSVTVDPATVSVTGHGVGAASHEAREGGAGGGRRVSRRVGQTPRGVGEAGVVSSRARWHSKQPDLPLLRI